jgi:translocator protein
MENINVQGTQPADGSVSRIAAFIVCIALPQAAGYLGSVFTRPATEAWYQSLDKPWFTPPDITFGIVWPVLYLMMGIASYLIWKERKTHPTARTGIYLYGIQLVLNLAWSILFFGIKSTEAAFYEIVVLILVVIITTIVFFRVRRAAGWLMVPYLLWLIYAAMLNYSIWIRNPV